MILSPRTPCRPTPATGADGTAPVAALAVAGADSPFALARGTVDTQARHHPGEEVIGELISHDVSAARRHIIKRPRLTRLLDETTARIILLVAPAGYGKTTLAREWLEESGRQALWYQARRSSTDVAALAADLADVLRPIVPSASAEVQDVVQAAHPPDMTAQQLARTLSRNLDGWPHKAWLVIDDYHVLEEGDAPHAFISELLAEAPLQILVTSRLRPAWITARRLVYGEAFEVGQNLLAMTHEEAEAVLSSRPRREISGLLALAEGWPAVIALASFAETISPPDVILPDSLYRFLADEIVEGVEPSIRGGLGKLATAPVITAEIARLLLAEDATKVVQRGVDLGLLVPEGVDRFEMHPLLRDFFERRVWHRSRSSIQRVFRLLAEYHLSRREWDEALTVIERLDEVYHLPHFLDMAQADLLRHGRLETIRRSIELARARSIDAPEIDLLEAEVAFRYGQHEKALRLALSAVNKRAHAPGCDSHAWYLAGQCASFLDDTAAAVEYYEQAERTAQTDGELRDALWGQFTASLTARVNEAPVVLERLEAVIDGSAETTLRLACAKASTAVKMGASILEALDTFERARPDASEAEPLTQSSFYHSYAYLLLLNAQYEEALAMASRELEFLEAHRLAFARPHALHLYAAACAGLRRFAKATKALDPVRATRGEAADTYVAMNVAALEVRILLALGDTAGATAIGHLQWPHVPSPSVLGELQASLALAAASAGDSATATELCRTASGLARSIEIRVLTESVGVIVADLTRAPDLDRLAKGLLATVQETGNIDGFIWAYRAYPRLLAISAEGQTPEALKQIIVRGRDSALVGRVSPTLRYRLRGGGALTPRERDVLELLTRGASNRHIAEALYISEGTVKAHVRNVLAKLGARSRAEAAAIFASRLG
jgi:DNA-binding CsgD family transcriptional regulator/tetratricopeptide (TPR) repeat protein